MSDLPSHILFCFQGSPRVELRDAFFGGIDHVVHNSALAVPKKHSLQTLKLTYIQCRLHYCSDSIGAHIDGIQFVHAAFVAGLRFPYRQCRPPTAEREAHGHIWATDRIGPF